MEIVEIGNRHTLVKRRVKERNRERKMSERKRERKGMDRNDKKG